MQGSVLTQIALPLILAMIMFGMGLGLTVADFSRILKLPKAVFAGLLGQLVLMPILAVAIVWIFSLPAPLAIGMMILAACPGGTMSNVFSQLARANMALSVTLTAISTFICVFTTPFIIGTAIEVYSGQTSPEFSVIQTTVSLIFITLIPVTLGIIVRHNFFKIAQQLEPYFRRFSGVFVILMIIAILIQERHTLVDSFSAVFSATLALNLLAVTVGLVLGVITKLSSQDGITLGIEVGIQNAAMAILIAVTLLKQPEYATAAGVYGLAMYIGAALLVLLSKRTNSVQVN